MDSRLQQLTLWLQQNLAAPITRIDPIQNDASFRRYFRVMSQEQSWIAMDAPPEKEDCQPFCTIAQGLFANGIQVPEIFVSDYVKGFLLLSDFGDQTVFSLLQANNVNQLYSMASAALFNLQRSCVSTDFVLPFFDANFMRTELYLFLDWYLGRHLKLVLSSAQQEILQATFALLIDNAEQQPQVFIHRDYHSRNLMLLPGNTIGMLDFQDAMCGPITYDLVSLLKDCYIAWPIDKVQAWALDYLTALTNGQLIDSTPRQFLRWFDLMGLQRHLKVLGIFARLHYRDNKCEHLKNAPRILKYIADVLINYSDLQSFKELMAAVILPVQYKVHV